MRVSIYANDSGRPNYEDIRSRGCHVKVMLDGVEQKGVYTADDETGYVQIAAVPFRVMGGQIATEELYGKVEIIEVKE